MGEKETLHHYLRVRRENLLGKLDGLSEYDVRRPVTPTGTNLLGLVKHVASVELGYFGEVFGRPSGRHLRWLGGDASPDADMWATADETREEILELHRFAAAHSDATIEALPPDAAGIVPWWPEERRHVTLHQILVHMLAERSQHLGHADILRELVDGSAGQRPADPNLTPRSTEEWAAHRAAIEDAARAASNTAPENAARSAKS
ncbi:DinB family protein [Arthrobacter sp. B6]|uniref:DinB family protein n=1 Tax=Arthrobacter sp. B6 TaxID=1570137 RepID=UPI00082AEB01|nr:DinB family protein [Arthrobacter sp. B6]